MLENIRRENDEPRRIAAREFRKVVYGDHPMGWEPTVDTVTAITRDDLVAYHKAFFRPNNTLIGISGDVTREEIMSALGAALGGWEQARVTIEPEPELEVSFTPSVDYVEKDTNQGVIMIGHLGANTHDKNLPAIRIMNFILGGGSFTSRITQKVRTDEGLAYAAYSRYGDSPWTRGLFTASSQTRSDATARAISLIIDIIRRMHDEGPTADEVERAKDTYLNNHVFDYESKGRVVSRLLELAWEDMPLDTPERDIETIESLTVDDVRRAAAEYLHPDGLTILVVGEQSTFDQPLSNFGPVNVIQLAE
jgi:predicted Zn-dependent peptidase